ATSERSLALLPLLAPFQAPIRFAFAYGSAAFAQSKENSSESSKPVMLDLIFGVTHPHHWHSINLHQNPHHYSCLAGLGSSMLAWVQEFSAGVYFNPYVNLNGTIVKYGVVSIDRLSKDLTEWDTFYLAGRMQKPVPFSPFFFFFFFLTNQLESKKII
ncbi:Mitochondrial translocator assembly and maintenance protein 41, partial [Coelomomyces lativittatus]